MKYVRVVQWSATDDGVRLEMLGDDENTHQLDVSAECVAALAAALGAESARFEDKEQQLIRPKGMQTGHTEQGEPMLLMRLDGGAELPLVFKVEALGVLISELEKLKAVVQPGSQIRWN